METEKIKGDDSMMSNYNPPTVQILYFTEKEVFLTVSTDGTEGLYYDKWTDQTGGIFY